MENLISINQKRIILAGIIFSFLYAILASFFSSKLLEAFYAQSSLNATMFFETRLVYWGLLLLMYFYVITVERLPLLYWKDKKYSFMFYFLSVVITLLIGYTLNGIANTILYFSHLFTSGKKMHEYDIILKNNIVLVVFTSLTAGVVEEFVFRGYIMSRLQILFNNKYITVIGSSLLFACAHLSYGTLTNFFTPLMIGLVFAIHYQRYRNIKIVIICHFLFDLISLLIMTKTNYR